MPIYTVHGFESTWNKCKVEADSEEEAILKAQNNEDVVRSSVDTGPFRPVLWPKRWQAELSTDPNNPYGN